MKIRVFVVEEHDWYEYQGISLVTADEDEAWKEGEKMGRTVNEFTIEVKMDEVTIRSDTGA